MYFNLFIRSQSFTWIYEKFNKGIIPSSVWWVEGRQVVQQVMSCVEDS